MLLQSLIRKAWYKLLSTSGLSISLHVSCTIIRQTSFRGVRNIIHENNSNSNTLKRSKLKLYISLKENKLACFANSWGSFQIHDLVHHFWKNSLKVHVSSPLWYEHAPNVSPKHTKKIVDQNFQFFQPLNYLYVN